MPLSRSGGLFFAPTALSDGRQLEGEKPSKREGHPGPPSTGGASYGCSSNSCSPTRTSSPGSKPAARRAATTPISFSRLSR